MTLIIPNGVEVYIESLKGDPMGAASDYTKADVIAFADALSALVTAITQDGPGTDDLDELIAVITNSAAALNELRGVPAAAGLHIGGRISDKQGDRVLEQAIAAEMDPPTP